MAKYFTCVVCKGEFEQDWSDEEAIQEMKDNFGQDMITDQCELVCDDCYQKMNAIIPMKGFRDAN
jgi:hypothetical protein